MALIKCHECGKEISDTVKTCPHCGYKLRGVKRTHRNMSKSQKKLIIIATVCFVAILGLIGILHTTLSLSNDERVEVISINNLIAEIMAVDIEGKTEEQMLSCKEQCQDIVEEYSKLQWKQKRKIKNYDSVEEKISDIDNEINSLKQSEIKNVINLIDSISDVNLESQSDINNVRSEYDKLDEEQKRQVTNYSELDVYQSKYDEICIKETINRIKNIGKVSLENDSYKKILSAEMLYDSMRQEIRKKVSNYNTLKSKRKKYDKLNKYRRLLQDVKAEMKDGCLNAAKGILKKIPSKFKYKGTKVSTLKKQLSSKSAWVALCGRWVTTGGQMRVTQVWDYDGRSQWWYRDFEKGEESISVKCQLLKSGKVKVKIRGSIPIYTSYSSIEAGLESGNIDLSKTKTMSSMGTIKIDSHTTMTLSSTGITVNYYMVNPNENQYFTYKYKTTMSLRKKAEKY